MSLPNFLKGPAMCNDTFPVLLDFTAKALLKRWIPQLTLRSSLAAGNGLEGESFSPVLFSRTHCVRVGEVFLVFEIDKGKFFAAERAIMDWTVSKVSEYARSGLRATELEHILCFILPEQLIAAYLLHKETTLDSGWKVFTEGLEYFGPTAHYLPRKRPDVFDEKDQDTLRSIHSLMTTLEKFSSTTNEGNRFACTVAVLGHEKNPGGQTWSELSKKQFIKCLAGESAIFFLDTDNRFVRYSDISEYKKKSCSLEDEIHNAECLTSEKDSQALWEQMIGFKYDFPEQESFIVHINNSGDIFVYKDRVLLFQHRGQSWAFLTPRIAREKLHGIASYAVSNKVRITLRDKMLENSGCCLGVFSAEAWETGQLRSHIVPGEIETLLFESGSVHPNFWENSQDTRKRLLSIDGAVLIEAESGKIYAIGAIIKNTGASGQGARTTAAKTIASLGGMAAKVSDDGHLEIYAASPGMSIDTITPVLILGK